MNNIEEHEITISEEITAVSKFEDMGLSEDILNGLYSFGFETPSIIQQRAIGPIIAGRDIIAQSQSGTGKTATFLIGILQKMDPSLVLHSSSRLFLSRLSFSGHCHSSSEDWIQNRHVLFDRRR